LEIVLQMVRLLDETANEEPLGYVGCILKSTASEEVLYSFVFDKALTDSPSSLFEANCKHVVCFPTEDGKMARWTWACMD
jgi:hypothetical protein